MGKRVLDAIRDLHTAVRKVLLFHPRVVTNYASTPTAASESFVEANAGMAEAAEILVVQLVRVLSYGLHEGLELWTVLETLERVPNKISHEDSSSRSKKALHRLKFSGQLVYLVKSTFVRSTAAVRTRALLRLALNQGVLLASLELISRWNVAELAAFYADPSVSVLCCVDGALWDAFLSACAAVGGVTLTDIEEGVPKGVSVVKFDMKLALPGVDLCVDHAIDGSNNASEPGNCDQGSNPNDEDEGGGRDANVVSRKGHSSSSHPAVSLELTEPGDGGGPLYVHVLPVDVRLADGRRGGVHRRKTKKTKKAVAATMTWTVEAATGVTGAIREENGIGGKMYRHCGAPGALEEVPDADYTGGATGTCMQAPEPLDVRRLLDRAEAILVARWGQLAADIAAQERLLFERAGSG